jgi:hypothetical protein
LLGREGGGAISAPFLLENAMNELKINAERPLRWLCVDEHVAVMREVYAHIEGSAGYNAVMTVLAQALAYWETRDDTSAGHAAIDAAGRILFELDTKETTNAQV